MNKLIKIYTDGSSIGNPGPGGYGIVMLTEDGEYKKEFSQGNIIDSYNIDFQKSEFINKINLLDKEKKYIIYCRSGNRSEKASLIMKSLGFKSIYHYKNGYNDWIKD